MHILGKFQMAISPRGVVRSTSCLVLRRGFRGRRIEWRYFRFRQIQDGGAILEATIYLEKFKWQYLRGGSSDLLRVWFQDGVFAVGGSNGAGSLGSQCRV